MVRIVMTVTPATVVQLAPVGPNRLHLLSQRP